MFTRKLALFSALVLALGLLVLIGLRSWVAVDETEYVLLTSFGRPVAVYGAEPEEAGFHLKWPWQSAWRIDRRLQVFDAPAREVITGDKKNLDVSSSIVWRVDNPSTFLAAAGTVTSAEARLDERVSSALSNAIGRRELDNLASTEETVWQLDTLTREILKEVRVAARQELGVDVRDVRLRRFSHPIEVRPAVFDLIRSERQQVAATLRAEGEARYRTLTSQADRERDAILAQADADADRIRADGEAESTRLLNDAHALDPEFYEFLRTLETYRSILDERATIVLSSANPLLRLLTEGPVLDHSRAPAPSTRAEAVSTPSTETGP